MTAFFLALDWVRRNLSLGTILGVGATLALALGMLLIGNRMHSLERQRYAAVAERDAAHAALELEREQNKRVVAQSEAVSAMWDAKYRAIEAQMNDKERTADAALAAEKSRIAAAATAHRAADDSLRDALARAWATTSAAAAAAGGASDPAVAEWRDRATRCSQLLVDGVRLQGTLAEAAETRSAEVRRMLERERTLGAVK